MSSTDRTELLRGYAASKNEGEFRMLVEHYLPLVHAAALRRTGGNAALSAEISQDVFIALAKKASALVGRTTLAPWLLRTTHLAALQRVRSEQRRLEREQRAYTMEQRATAAEEIDWVKLRPLLDQLLSKLGQNEQEAIFLRFFEGLTFAQIGARLNIGEDGARQRSNRALERLRTQLARRGIRSTAAIFSQALASQYAGAAPAGLASSIATTALASSIAAGSTAAAPLIFLSMNASKIAIYTLALIAVAGTGGTLYNAQRHERAEAQAKALKQEQAALHAEVRDLRARFQRSNAAIASPDGAAPVPSAAGELIATPAPASRRTAATTSARPPESIEALLAQIDHVLEHPELRPAFVGQIVQQLWGEDQRFFAIEGTSPQQIEAIREEAAAYATMLLEARAKRIGGENFAELFAAADDHSLAQVRRILGEDTFARLREYKANANENRLVDQLAARLYYTDTPLTGAQAAQLATILVQSRFSSDRSASQTITGRVISSAEHAAFRRAQSGARVALITDAAIARAQAQGNLPAATLAVLQNLQASQSAQLQLASATPPEK